MQLPPLSTSWPLIDAVLVQELASAVPGDAAVGAGVVAGIEKKLPLVAVTILCVVPPIVISMVAPAYGVAPPESAQSVPAIEYSGAAAPVWPTK